jgi:hypothetical protein
MASLKPSRPDLHIIFLSKITVFTKLCEDSLKWITFCISIANVVFSVYLFSIDVLKFSKKICIGYFYTVNFLYHTAEYIFKFINLWNKNYLLKYRLTRHSSPFFLSCFFNFLFLFLFFFSLQKTRWGNCLICLNGIYGPEYSA